MNEHQTNWTDKELFTYILIYCMKADFKGKITEEDYIKEKLGGQLFIKMLDEFNADNDLTKAIKIKSTVDALELNEGQKETLLNDMEELFTVDGDFDIIERGQLIALKKLIGVD